METRKQKLRREIANIWYEIKLDIQIPAFTFLVVAVCWFIYIKFFTVSDYTIKDAAFRSLQTGLFVSVATFITGLIFQLMSAATGSSFSYKGTVVARPDDLDKNDSRIKLYVRIIIKIFRYLKSK